MKRAKVTTAAENEIDVADGLERAVCVYVRAIANERVRADKCFGTLSPSPPPPPDTGQGALGLLRAAILKRQVRRGEGAGAAPVPDLTNEEQYAAEAAAAEAEQLGFLEQLAADNYQLRDILGDISAKARSEGRRLWQRPDSRGSHALAENILATSAFGTTALHGLTVAECEALCSAIDNETIGRCTAIAFARASAHVRDLTTRQCYLLKDIGGCTPATFAGAVYARRDTDGCTNPTAHDNPLCVQLSAGRQDLRVLDFASAEQSCRNGKGAPRVAWPKTLLESFSMLGYAREHGITAFWSDAPHEGGEMAWTGDDGLPFVVPPGNRRCVLVSTVDTSPHGHMFAELHSCNARLADGVVCESAMAYPPPPAHSLPST